MEVVRPQPPLPEAPPKAELFSLTPGETKAIMQGVIRRRRHDPKLHLLSNMTLFFGDNYSLDGVSCVYKDDKGYDALSLGTAALYDIGRQAKLNLEQALGEAEGLPPSERQAVLRQHYSDIADLACLKVARRVYANNRQLLEEELQALQADQPDSPDIASCQQDIQTLETTVSQLETVITNGQTLEDEVTGRKEGGEGAGEVKAAGAPASLEASLPLPPRLMRLFYP